MLHVILGILKLIGTLLLALIVLVIVILLLVLLVPVRYRLEAVHTDQDTRGEAHITWLFHFLSVRMAYDLGKRKSMLQIRILGISPESVRSFRKKRRRRRARKVKSAESSGNAQKSRTSVAPHKMNSGAPKGASSGSQNTGFRNPERKTAKSGETEKWEKQSLEEKSLEEKSLEEKSLEEKSLKEKSPEEKIVLEKKNSFRRRIPAFFDIIRQIPDLLRHLACRLKKAAAMPGQMAERFREFRRKLDDSEAFDVVNEAWGEVRRLLHHFRVRKGFGYLRFGTGDPALTGELTGVLYLVLPVSCSQISVEPRFTEAMLETEIAVSGHIRMVHLIRTGWWAFRSKRLRNLICVFRS